MFSTRVRSSDRAHRSRPTKEGEPSSTIKSSVTSLWKRRGDLAAWWKNDRWVTVVVIFFLFEAIAWVYIPDWVTGRILGNLLLLILVGMVTGILGSVLPRAIIPIKETLAKIVLVPAVLTLILLMIFGKDDLRAGTEYVHVCVAKPYMDGFRKIVGREVVPIESVSCGESRTSGNNTASNGTPAKETEKPPFAFNEEGWRKTLGEWMAASVAYPEITREMAEDLAAHCVWESKGCNQFEADGTTVVTNGAAVCKMQIEVAAHKEVYDDLTLRGKGNFDPMTEDGCMNFSVALVRWNIANNRAYDADWVKSESHAKEILAWLKSRPAPPVINVRSTGGRNVSPDATSSTPSPAKAAEEKAETRAEEENSESGPDLSGCTIYSVEARILDRGSEPENGKTILETRVYLATDSSRAVYFKAGDYSARIPPDTDEEHPWQVPVDGPFNNVFFWVNGMNFERIVAPVRIYGCE